jgi:hypothetical protein
LIFLFFSDSSRQEWNIQKQPESQSPGDQEMIKKDEIIRN